MERFATALEMVFEMKPEAPVFAARPHAAGRAARWFIKNFPGEVAYAYKANSSVFLLGALYGAGIKQFDVASIAELEDAATIPGVRLHFMHPVKSRHAIRREMFSPSPLVHGTGRDFDGGNCGGTIGRRADQSEDGCHQVAQRERAPRPIHVAEGHVLQ